MDIPSRNHVLARYGWIATALFAASLALPGGASAQINDAPPPDSGSDFPVPIADRPLTLPQYMLEIDASLSIVGIQGISDVGVGLNVGASFGVLDDLEVGLVFLPLSLSPDFDFNDISLYGRYRFVDSDFLQIGGELGMNIPIEGRFSVRFGLPVRLNFSGILRLDTGIGFTVLTDPGDFVMDIPIGLRVSATDNIYFGADTGIQTDFDGLVMPLLFTVGYTVGGNTPVVDLEAFGGFPLFFVKAGGGSDVITEAWAFGVRASVYLDFSGN